ncbi:Respiratory supercomplex factor 1, mitochondrial [Purpureocillium takamizusanense]|uniref:Respiratory supercomplex factor 1, mitochondrial n=1 Tax=Purpureocillium takamizusanense TaxID=2060973 RepID=A0A9Q8QPU8_9HYPO|nr:Respiratory supercomplex factor 1, mitochondrial [Purpureocillium takamizusanense]UNI23187.1 Respiratory supercomplex factor 1, mitochondrial [Purpureocillium takamizusanense]
MADRAPPPPMPGPLPSSFDDNLDFYNERPMQKVVRKIKEEPLVPLGIGLTVFAFVNAYRALRRGDSRQANKMFRARVAAQGFTVIAMVAGSMYYSKDREKTKELRKLKEQRDAEEKRQKWIRELEVRDEEDKAMRARLSGRSSSASETPEPPTPAAVTAVDGETAPETKSQGTGGILGKMGLWSQGEKAAAAEAAEQQQQQQPAGPDSVEEKKPTRKENPKSSLGAIGEVIASKKKD